MRHRNLLEEIGFALLCLALTLFFFHAAIFHRSGTFLYNYDNTYQYYPWMHKLASDWRSLSAPLWDFSVEAGIPFPGEIQTGAFYPVNILYVWLSGVPTPAKLDFLILLHFAGGMWGMTLFLRQRGINRWASLFAGAVFCWVGPVAARAHSQANIFAGLVYLPWVLYFFERAIRSGRPVLRNAPAGLCGLVLAFSLLAGHPQPFIHNGLMLALFAIFLFLEPRPNAGPWKTSLLHFVAILAGVAVVCFLFAFVQLAAAQEYFARAYRWVGLPNPIKALDVVPLAAFNLYKLSPPDLFGIFSVRPGKDSGTLFLTITALVCACFGVGFPGRLRWFALIVAAFALTVALANSTPIGSLFYHLPVLNLVREPVRIIYLYQFCVATLVGAGLQVATSAIRPWRLRGVLSLIVIALFVCEARWNGGQVLGSIRNPISASHAYQRTPLIGRLESENSLGLSPRRVFARPKDLIPPNGGDVFHINTVLGHRSSMLISHFDLLSRDWSVSSPGLDQLGARYFLTDVPVDGLLVLATEGNKTLYERTSAQPILRLESSSGAVSEEGINQVAWKRNGLRLRVETKEPMTRLVFAESAFPGWSVRVNGARVALEQSGPFMSVWLNAGNSVVDWTYRPWWFVPGMIAWLIGMLLLLSAALPNRWVRKEYASGAFES